MTDQPQATGGISEGLAGRKRLAKNTGLTALTSLSDGLLLLLLILAGRFLGAEGFGVFSFALAATSFITFGTNLGLDSLAIREIAINKPQASYLIGVVLTWKTVLTAVATTVFLIVVSVWIDDPTTLTATYIMCTGAVLRSYNMTFRSYLQAFERFSLETRIVWVERFLLFGLGVVILVQTRNPVLLAWAFFASRLVASVVYVVAIRSSVCRFRLRWDYPFIKSFQARAFPLGVAVLIYGFYLQVDILILGALRSTPEVGIYSAALKVYEGALVVPLIINAVVYPRLSHLYSSDDSRFRDLAHRSFKYLTMLAAPLVASGFLFSREIVELLFGSAYAPASTALAMLLLAVGIRFVITVLFTSFRASGHQKSVMYTLLLGLVTRIVLSFGLVPIMGINGSALCMVIAELTMLIVSIRAVRAYGHTRGWRIEPTVKIAGSVAFAVAIGWILPGWPVAARLALVMIVYATVLFATRAFDRIECKLILSLVPSPVYQTITRMRRK